MDKALHERTRPDLNASLDGVEETIGRKRKLQGMLRKVEEEKSTVAERIYVKVKAEYRRQLDEVLAVLMPIERELGEAKEAASAEIKELNSMIDAAKEEKLELEFRFKVGEYDEPAFTQKEHALRISIEEKTRRKKDLLDAFKKYDGLYDALRGGAEPSPDRADGSKELRSHDAPVSPHGANDAAEPYENPLDWLDDVSPQETTIPAVSAPFEHILSDRDSTGSGDALFENLSDSAGKEPDEVRERTLPDAAMKPGRTAAAGKTPFLILKTAGGSERRIPLLPVTLSIGREHDNNIEVKDEEAARYHARIIHKNREYCIESLDGSRNTLVNGKGVSRAVLHDGDTITIGRTSLVFSA